MLALQAGDRALNREPPAEMHLRRDKHTCISHDLRYMLRNRAVKRRGPAAASRQDRV